MLTQFLLLSLAIFLIAVFIILNVIDPGNEYLHWYSGIVFFGILCTAAVYLREYVLPGIKPDSSVYSSLSLVVRYFLFISSTLGPYPALLFCLSYSQLFNRKKKILSVLFIVVPALESVFMHPIDELTTPPFKIIVSTAAIYYLLGAFFLSYSFLRERNFKLRQQRFITLILYVPLFFFVLLVNFIVPAFGMSDPIWKYDIWIILVVILYAVFASKHGVLGFRLKLEKEAVDSTMRTMASGFLNHTLKNEINKVAITAENIKFSQSKAEIDGGMDIIIKAAIQMKEMINRVNRQLQEVYLKETVNCLNEITDYCLDNVSPYMKDKRIEIVKHYECDVYLVCDIVHVREVLSNIFINAIDAVESSGKINIRLYESKNYYILEIHDNGCGISRENISRIAEPFWSTKNSVKNTGLGLTYCSKIMQYYGSFEIHSELTKGTTIFLNFSKRKALLKKHLRPKEAALTAARK